MSEADASAGRALAARNGSDANGAEQHTFTRSWNFVEPEVAMTTHVPGELIPRDHLIVASRLCCMGDAPVTWQRGGNRSRCPTSEGSLTGSPRGRSSPGSHQDWMKLWQIPLEPGYPMAFQAVSEPTTSPISPKWQDLVGSNKYRDVQESADEEQERKKSFHRSFLLAWQKITEIPLPTSGNNFVHYSRLLHCRRQLFEALLLQNISLVPLKSLPQQKSVGKRALSAMRDSPSMVQKLLEEEREAVKSALQAVDQHMQLKKKEVEEVQRKLLKDEPIKEHIRAALQMDLRNNRHRLPNTYTPFYNQAVKKPVFLEAISEEDNEQVALPVCGSKMDKRLERVRHSALSRDTSGQSRYSLKEKLSSAKPRMSEVSVLPPIDVPWTSIAPSEGRYKGPLNYRWQRVADNYIDSDVRVRSRRRCRGRAYETHLRLGYQDDDETEDEFSGLVEREMRLPRKRKITFGPPYSTSYSKWLTHLTDADGSVN